MEDDSDKVLQLYDSDDLDIINGFKSLENYAWNYTYNDPYNAMIYEHIFNKLLNILLIYHSKEKLKKFALQKYLIKCFKKWKEKINEKNKNYYAKIIQKFLRYKLNQKKMYKNNNIKKGCDILITLMKNKNNNLKKFFNNFCKYKNNKKMQILFNINTKYINRILQSKINQWKKISEKTKKNIKMNKIIKKYINKKKMIKIY